MIDNDGMPEDRIEVIYNGVEPSTFAQRPHDRQLIAQSWPSARMTSSSFKVARLDYLKDHATAIRPWNASSRNAQVVRLLLIGEGPERRGDQKICERKTPVRSRPIARRPARHPPTPRGRRYRFTFEHQRGNSADLTASKRWRPECPWCRPTSAALAKSFGWTNRPALHGER